MGINKAYWLWGLFPSEETNFLNEIKAKVQSKLISPLFQTHITLTGPYLKIDNSFLNKLKAFGENNSAIMLDIKGYDFKQEIFQSFYISIKNSQHLKNLRRNIYELDKFDLKNNYSPHISLTYGNHGIQEKKEWISQLPKLKKRIKMSQIALFEIDEDINRWKILESFDLS